MWNFKEGIFMCGNRFARDEYNMQQGMSINGEMKK
jgi:hypothetical protein